MVLVLRSRALGPTLTAPAGELWPFRARFVRDARLRLSPASPFSFRAREFFLQSFSRESYCSQPEGQVPTLIRPRLIRTFTAFKREHANSPFTPFKRRSNDVQTRIQGHFRPFGPKRLAPARRLRRSNVVQTTQTNVRINLGAARVF
jgi:hypothetical protein